MVTLVILPLAFIFALAWATHQNSPLAWVGQNLMVRKIHGPVSEPNVLSLFTVLVALSSVTVLTDTVLLHSGHLHDDSSIASGAYAKHKSTSGYGLTCYGSTSLQDDVFSSSAFVNWSTSLTLTRFRSFFQVASALLVAAFFYDIFWVFISPLIFKKSVMITVSLKSNHRWLLNTSCRELSIAEMKSRKNSGCSWQR